MTKILAIPWAMTSPLRAEVYIVNMKVFPNLKWGTRDPVAFKDTDLGLIRLRAHGVFNIQVVQPVLFINTLVGTMGIFTTEEVEEYLKRVIVSRFNDHLGEHLDSLFNLPGRYDELSEGLQKRLQDDFSRFGIGLEHLYITCAEEPGVFKFSHPAKTAGVQALSPAVFSYLPARGQSYQSLSRELRETQSLRHIH